MQKNVTALAERGVLSRGKDIHAQGDTESRLKVVRSH